MKNKIRFALSSIFCFLIAASAYSQSGSVAGGGDATGTGGTVSYSVGQTDYQAESSGSGSVSKGLQHPYEISIISGIDQLNILLTSTVYPNPTVSYITLSISDFEPREMTYNLLNVQGRFIERKDLISPQTDIDMSHLADGTYLLKVHRGLNEVKTFKIIKNN